MIIYQFLWAIGFMFEFTCFCLLVGMVVDWAEKKIKKALRASERFMRWLSK